MFTPLSNEKCVQNIARIKKSAKLVQDLIHVTACSALAHIRDHGNYTIGLQLLEAMPSGQRVKTLAFWFSHFSDGAVKFSYNKSAGWTCKLAKKRYAEQFDVEAAYATTYGDLLPEPTPNTLTLKAAIGYLKRKANDNKTNDDGSPKVSDEARELFAKLYNEATEMYPNLGI